MTDHRVAMHRNARHDRSALLGPRAPSVQPVPSARRDHRVDHEASTPTTSRDPKAPIAVHVPSAVHVPNVPRGPHRMAVPVVPDGPSVRVVPLHPP